jgi:cellobiose phosphorylase
MTSLAQPAIAPRSGLLPMSDLPLIRLENAAGLVITLHCSGIVCAIHHRGIQINQFLPTALEQAWARILLQDGSGSGHRLVGAGAGLAFAVVDAHAVAWSGMAGSIAHRVELRLHPALAQWSWNVELRSSTAIEQRCDLFFGQDVALIAEGAARHQEAYISQYIDHRAERDAALGWIVLSRQNEPQRSSEADAVHPWIAHGCLEGASSFASDGCQFFGADHRSTGEPACLRGVGLPRKVQQHEFAFPSLQGPPIELRPGEVRKLCFFSIYEAHHAEPSSPTDVMLVQRRLAAQPVAGEKAGEAGGCVAAAHLLESPVLHGDELDEEDVERRFSDRLRHEERDPGGRLLAFFHGADEHVVLRAKEALVERPHGWVMRSGRRLGIEPDAIGTTVYAAGIFSSQVHVGHPVIGRIIAPMRESLGLGSGGQRILVRQAGTWRRLGMPSCFVMTPHRAVWLYRFGGDEVRVTTATSARAGELRLEVEVLSGADRAFLVTSQLVFGDQEMASAGTLELQSSHWLRIRPGADSALARHRPGTLVALVPQDPAVIEALGGDEVLWLDGSARGAPYAVVRTAPLRRASFNLVAAQGEAALAEAVAQARSGRADPDDAALTRATLGGLAISHPHDGGVARLQEILPWFAHHAWIHFTAPHGLEQCDGGAYGTRDVSQGDLEWLLSVGAHDQARELLVLLFRHQFLSDGSFPQYFMLPPFDHFQSPHAHGDKPMWPLKAVADYIEATGDAGILDQEVAYTAKEGGSVLPVSEPIHRHVQRLLAHIATRLRPGTALIDYGDGDWDDTLQPADPALRSTMVSAWTVELCYQAVSQYAAVCRACGRDAESVPLETFRDNMRADFASRLMPDGVVAGFAVIDGETVRPVIHPSDQVTGIRYRLLPMTRGIISGIFTPEQARSHAGLIDRHLLCPDGARLTSDPIRYEGGRCRLFRRAETSAHFGREVGQLYLHAHIRYAEAMARLGEADRLWRALQVVIPLGLDRLVPNAAPRQSNIYFTSSDGAFADRYEAHRRYQELLDGTVTVKAGWRFHSSGPGLFISTVVRCLLGLRREFDDAVLDPCLPRCVDGLRVQAPWAGHLLDFTFHVTADGAAARRVLIGGHELISTRRAANPYRAGGLALPVRELGRVVGQLGRHVEVYC